MVCALVWGGRVVGGFVFVFTTLDMLLTTYRRIPRILKPGISFRARAPIVSRKITALALGISRCANARPIIIPIAFDKATRGSASCAISTRRFICNNRGPMAAVAIARVNFGTRGAVGTSLAIPRKFITKGCRDADFGLRKGITCDSFVKRGLGLLRALPMDIKIDGLSKAPCGLRCSNRLTMDMGARGSATIRNARFGFPGNGAIAVTPRRDRKILGVRTITFRTNGSGVILGVRPSGGFSVKVGTRVAVAVISCGSFLSNR